MRGLTDPARSYAESVLAGDIVAGKLVRASCKRFIDDLARGDWPYYYDEAQAKKWIEFYPALLSHYKGVRKPFELDQWQCFIIANLMGWRHRETDIRRFRRAFLSVAKKNGKSAWTAGMALGLLLIDNEPAAEVYTAATTMDQAKIVWTDCYQFATRSKALSSALKCNLQPAGLYDLVGGGVLKPLSSDPPDGLNVHAAIIDEYHEHPDEMVMDIVRQGTVGRRQPLVIAITTAGYDQFGPCKVEWDLASSIVLGTVENEQYFSYIATLDDDDDWRDEANWIKANPGLGTVKPWDGIRAEYQEAIQRGQENKFRVKQCNQWVSGTVRWIDLEQWNALPKL